MEDPNQELKTEIQKNLEGFVVGCQVAGRQQASDLLTRMALEFGRDSSMYRQKLLEVLLGEVETTKIMLLEALGRQGFFNESVAQIVEEETKEGEGNEKDNLSI